MRAALLIGTLLAANMVTAIFVIQTKHHTRALQNELQMLRLERDALNTEWAQLQLEESAWANYGRVERIAREDLAMHDPESVLILERRR